MPQPCPGCGRKQGSGVTGRSLEVRKAAELWLPFSAAESLQQRKPHFVQIQLMFDATKDFVIQPALIAQTDDCVAFDAHQLPKQLFVSRNMRNGFVTIGIPFRFLQGAETMAVALFDFLVHIMKLFAIALLLRSELR